MKSLGIISFFAGGVRDTAPVDVSVERLVDLIARDGKVKELTEKYRYFKEKGFEQDATACKNRMPTFAVAVGFDGGKSEKYITRCTYLSLVDLDKLDPAEMARLWALVCGDPHTMLAYPTISGRGLRVVFRYADPEGCCMEELFLKDRKRAMEVYADFYRQGNEYYGALLGTKEYDQHCKDCTRISGLAHCAEVFFRPEAEPFVFVVPEVAEKKKRKSPKKVKLERALKAAKRMLNLEGLVYEVGHRNRYVSRLCYLLNGYGVDKEELMEWAKGEFADYQDEEGNGVERVVNSCYKQVKEHGTVEVPNDKVKGCSSVEEIERFLVTQADIRFNVISRKCELRFKDRDEEEFMELTDRCGNTLWSRMNKQVGYTRMGDLYNVLQSEFVPEFDPFVTYFEGLAPWDGKRDAIAELAARVHVADDKQERFVHFFRKWLVAMVASLLDKEAVNQIILVLIGKQGVYKTTWLRRLLPPELKRYFYTKTNSHRFTKDDQFTLTEFALMCFEEIDSMSYADVNQLKALTTIDNINERMAYGRNKENRPHIASFCATGNNLLYLTDDTGSRRFLTYEVTAIESPYEHPVDYAAVYSQAHALWKSGFNYWLDDEEIQELQVHNECFKVPNVEEELILSHFHVPQEGVNEEVKFMTNADILVRINAGLKSPLSPKRVGMVMKRMGFPQKRSATGQRGYLLVAHSFDEMERGRYVPKEA